MFKFCEFCNQEHDSSYGSGRFCSSKCARGFSTKVKRKETGLKISKSLKGRVKKDPFRFICKYCGTNTDSRRCCCSNCVQWHLNVSMFNKLGIMKKNTPLVEISNKAFKILEKHYYIDKWSTVQIKEKYGIGVNTTYDFFKKHGKKLRNLSEAILTSIETGRTVPQDNLPQFSKRGTHITWDEKKVYLRSSYEFEYAKKLDELKIKYDVESLRIKYYDSLKKKERIAVPDFYLINQNKIVEIKSSYTLDFQNMKDKAKVYLDMGYNFELWVDKEQVKLYY